MSNDTFFCHIAVAFLTLSHSGRRLYLKDGCYALLVIGYWLPVTVLGIFLNNLWIGYEPMQRHYLKILEMARLGAISVFMLLMIFHHHANAHFTEQLKAMLDKPSHHMERASKSLFTIKQRLKRESPDYNSYDDNGDNLSDGENTNSSFEYPDSILDPDRCPLTLKYQLEEIFNLSYIGPVCNIIDVRNSADQLKDLENCTIVNGFVQLLFMHNLTDADLQKYRFPKLRVITHYLLVFRMFNLKTLRYMFPNLAVIGGLETFRGYSLVLFENFDMTEIGLQSLRFINNGNVRIEKNPSLCYIRTIDWSRLGSISNKKISAFMRNNRNPDECVDQCGDDSGCEDDEKGEGQLCWGLKACQKRSCPSECLEACDFKLQCTCHEECQAGCTRPNDPTACIACKNKYFNNTCLGECPEGKYLIHDWLCIEPDECQKLDWHFFEGKCLDMCPNGYQVNKTNCRKLCVKCQEDCGAVCEGDVEITTLESLHDVENCRAIEGALVIKINGGSEVVERLDSVLKDLEVVGTLVVHKSYPLVTLSFLKNLKRITGKHMQDEVYSVYFLENPNLEELWNITESNLVIEAGKAFFHVNPKLCRDKITRIRNLTPDVEDLVDISNFTNGNKATCEMKPIVLRKPEIYIKPLVIIIWENYEVKDYRTLIGYQVYYKESPTRNATQYDGVDACRLNSWNVIEMLKSTAKSERFSNESDDVEISDSWLADLKAYTQYAYYVRATTTSSAGAISEIQYFQTKPAKPSPPQNLKATALNTSSITVTWDPPSSPNGNITHYIIEWQREPETDIENARAVDTCKKVISRAKPTVEPTTPAIKSQPEIPTDKTCPKCDCAKEKSLEEEKVKAQESSDFENHLQDYLFPSALSLQSVGFWEMEPLEDFPEDEETFDAARKKRSVSNRPLNSSSAVGNITSLPTKLPSNESTAAAKVPVQYPLRRVIVTGTNVTLHNLQHFAEYNIHIYACNHASDPQTRTNKSFPIKGVPHSMNGNISYIPCSRESLTRRRSLPNKDYDEIPQDSIKVTREEGFEEDKIRLSWQMPSEPNGYIKSFNLEIKSTDSENGFNRKMCESVNETADILGYVSVVLSAPDKVPVGSYNVRIQPQSLAGKGIWSQPVKFTLTDPRRRTDSSRIVIIVSISLSFVIIAIIVGCVVYVKTMNKDISTESERTDMNPDYMRYVYIPDEYEIDEDKVKIHEEIGQGNFGKVYSGIAQDIVKGQNQTKVAVKKLHEKANSGLRYEFLKEASLMKAFNAYHVVRLLGVTSRTIDPMVIMEYMEKGDLKSHLRSRRGDIEGVSSDEVPPTLQEKLQMAAEIADGMAYLAAYKFVHRDLAARNCLVNEYGTVKIGDFGLTRDIYETDYYRKDSRGFLPIRWMAPESLKDGVFVSSSDVWSYGVVLWELATLAEQPYQGKPHDEVTRFVIDGGYMERPKDCPRKLYDLMTVCWQYNPLMRPEFHEIVNSLYVDVNNEFKEVCFYGRENQTFCTPKEQRVMGSNSSDSTEASYPDADSIVSPVIPDTESNGLPKSRVGNYYHIRKKPPATVPSLEERGLLAPETNPDTRSLNTTSTTATRTPSFGNKNRNRGGYGSGSSCENDTDEDEGLLQDGYISARDSGTFVHRRSRDRRHEHSARCNHIVGDQVKHKDCDLESGVDEGMWGNSASHSSASTPTDLQGLLSLDQQTGHMIMHAASSKC